MNRRQFIAGLLLAPIAARARKKTAQAKRCEWLKERVRHLDARLRAGYRGPAGRRLRGRRRQLAMERFRACR